MGYDSTLDSMCRIALWVMWCHMHVSTKLTVTTKLLQHRDVTYQNAQLNEENYVIDIL